MIKVHTAGVHVHVLLRLLCSSWYLVILTRVRVNYARGPVRVVACVFR